MAVGPEIKDAFALVKDDKSDTNYCICNADGKGNITLYKTGTGNVAELAGDLSDDSVSFVLLRMMSGDQESRRVKFVFIVWVGPKVGALTRGKATGLKAEIVPVIGQFHIEVRAGEDKSKELNEETLSKKLKAAGGADYDTGSNQGGNYKGAGAGTLKAQALASYKEREAEGNITNIVFEKNALPKVTPCDLKGRPMVAPPSEAQKNSVDNINDVNKWSAGG